MISEQYKIDIIILHKDISTIRIKRKIIDSLSNCDFVSHSVRFATQRMRI